LACKKKKRKGYSVAQKPNEKGVGAPGGSKRGGTSEVLRTPKKKRDEPVCQKKSVVK